MQGSKADNTNSTSTDMDTLIKYQQQLQGLVSSKSGAGFVFRGQGNRTALVSAVYQLLSSSTPSNEAVTPLKLASYLQGALIDPARYSGYDKDEHGRQFTELELLARLHHHGAATCLIEFTCNFHIALWFACDHEQSDGVVFIIKDIYDTSYFEDVTSVIMQKSIQELLENTESKQNKKTKSQCYFWKVPPYINFIIPHGCFLFSSSEIDKKHYVELVVKKEDKPSIRVALSKYFNLRNETLYKDITGFASLNVPSLKPAQILPQVTPANYSDEADKYFHQGKYSEALAKYTEAIKANPETAENYIHRGISLAHLGKHKHAIEDYNKAISLEKDDAKVYNNRGVSHERMEEYEIAIKDYSKAISLDQKFVHAYINRGNLLQRLGKNKTAILDYTKVVSIDPKNAEIYQSRAVCYISSEQYEKAIKDCDQAIQLNPKDDNAYYNRGVTYARMQVYDKAIADYTQCIKLNPRSPDAYNNLGAILRAGEEKGKQGK